jgi:hypothetical protein
MMSEKMESMAAGSGRRRRGKRPELRFTASWRNPFGSELLEGEAELQVFSSELGELHIGGAA